jgi:hypothetical protein
LCASDFSVSASVSLRLVADFIDSPAGSVPAGLVKFSTFYAFILADASSPRVWAFSALAPAWLICVWYLDSGCANLRGCV